ARRHRRGRTGRPAVRSHPHPGAVMTGVVDPYAATRAPGRFLAALNPLAKLAAPLPAIIVLIFVRDFTTPLVFIALGYLLLLVGAPLSRMVWLLLGVALPGAALIIGLGMSLWA